jgi:hypothetical protein
VERLARGWHLAKIALGVVRSDGSPLAISILGGLAAMLAALAFGIPAIVLFDRENDVLAAILAVLGGYAATFLAALLRRCTCCRGRERPQRRCTQAPGRLRLNRGRLQRGAGALDPIRVELLQARLAQVLEKEPTHVWIS